MDKKKQKKEPKIKDVFDDDDDIDRAKCITPLETSFEVLNWETSSVWVNGMTRVLTHMDMGSSLVHAVLNAFYIPYREGRLFNQEIGQVEFVHIFRRELSRSLLITNKETDKSYVEELGNGSWLEMTSTNLDVLSFQLKVPSIEFDAVMIEHLSNVTNKDIYIIDAELQDIITSVFELSTRYKKRTSVVILKLKNHYELLGIKIHSGEFITHFSHTHPWIAMLYALVQEKCQNISTKPT